MPANYWPLHHAWQWMCKSFAIVLQWRLGQFSAAIISPAVIDFGQKMVNLFNIRPDSVNCLPVIIIPELLATPCRLLAIIIPELLATPCRLLAMHLACQWLEVASCLPITGHFITPVNYFSAAGCTRSTRLADPKITLHFPRLYVHPHLSHAQYLRHVVYIVAMRPYLVDFSNLDGCFV